MEDGNRAKIGFRKSDNAFLAVDDVAALQAAADKLNPAIIRERLDYWSFWSAARPACPRCRRQILRSQAQAAAA
jgi:hypothetical protein